MGSTKMVQYLLHCIFSLVPVFGAYSQTIIKDGIFSALFSLFMAIYVECCIPTLREKVVSL